MMNLASHLTFPTFFYTLLDGLLSLGELGAEQTAWFSTVLPAASTCRAFRSRKFAEGPCYSQPSPYKVRLKS
jgi:hypothetical protein